MIPASYVPASPRGVLPQDSEGNVAFSFDFESGPVRIRMTEDGALWLVAGLIDAINQRRMKLQSASSSGSPNRDGSPQEGQNV